MFHATLFPAESKLYPICAIQPVSMEQLLTFVIFWQTITPFSPPPPPIFFWVCVCKLNWSDQIMCEKRTKAESVFDWWIHYLIQLIMEKKKKKWNDKKWRLREPLTSLISTKPDSFNRETSLSLDLPLVVPATCPTSSCSTILPLGFRMRHTSPSRLVSWLALLGASSPDITLSKEELPCAADERMWKVKIYIYQRISFMSFSTEKQHTCSAQTHRLQRHVTSGVHTITHTHAHTHTHKNFH